MKRFLSLLIVFLFSTMPFSARSDSKADSVIYNPTTDKEIRFMDIDWDLSCEEIVKTLQDKFDGETIHEMNLEKSNESFAPGDMKSYFYDVPVKEIVLKNDDESVDTIGHIAGQDVRYICAYFFENDPKQMYKIEIQFLTGTDDNMIKPHDSYDDLKTKLTKLYGEPYAASDYSAFDSKISLTWVGTKSTAVTLQIKTYFHTKTYVDLTYGRLDSTEIFSTQQKIVDDSYKETLDNISNDDSGL